MVGMGNSTKCVQIGASKLDGSSQDQEADTEELRSLNNHSKSCGKDKPMLSSDDLDSLEEMANKLGLENQNLLDELERMRNLLKQTLADNEREMQKLRNENSMLSNQLSEAQESIKGLEKQVNQYRIDEVEMNKNRKHFKKAEGLC